MKFKSGIRIKFGRSDPDKHKDEAEKNING
jgi:hypothetical protein